jgi:hypothetical protein
MSAKRQIKVPEFLKDMRSGLDDTGLMERYGLSADDLKRVLRKLVEAKAVTAAELEKRSAVAPDYPAPSMPSDFRVSRREMLDFPLPIYESDLPEVTGFVRDISDQGFGTKGIHAEVGETKIFVIPADKLFHLNPIEVEAVCRWTGKEGIFGEPVAGFEVTRVLGGNLEDLQILVRSLPLEDRIAMRKKY